MGVGVVGIATLMNNGERFRCAQYFFKTILHPPELVKLHTRQFSQYYSGIKLCISKDKEMWIHGDVSLENS